MTALDNQPVQRNFLSPTGFILVMKRCPNVQWFIQEANIPGISTGTPMEMIPNLQIPFQGEHLQFETFDITFKVGEDLADYLEISSWIRDSSTYSTSGYEALKEKKIYTGEGLKSEIVVMVLNSSKNPIFEITIHDAFPVALSGIRVISTTETVEYVTATASFRYTDFEIITTL